MTYFDLSHSLKNGMPFYPGTEAPDFSEACNIKKHGFKETRLQLLSHIGTHLDAPAHIFEAGASIDDLPLSHFTGKAFVLDVSNQAERIHLEMLKKYENEISTADFLILYSGWSQYWGTAAYFSGFPVLDKTAAVYLSRMHLKGVGLDTVSIDSTDNHKLPVHRIILSENTLIIENLKIPAEIIGKTLDFFAFPLKIEQGDGSPVRAVARS